MGGFGSGRRRDQRSKGTTQDMRGLDVRRLQREGVLTDNWVTWTWSRQGRPVASVGIRTEEGCVLLRYRNRIERIVLESTPCHLGSHRVWWQCPAAGCGRRSAVLYAGSTFACRRCHQLVYASQRESEANRVMRRADKIRRRLGWIPGIANADGSKPRAMHWRTFERFRAEHEAFANKLWAVIAPRTDRWASDES